MKNNTFGKMILCILLIVFMYVSAACSISNDNKKKDNKSSDEIDDVITTDVESAKIGYFRDTALVFLKAAQSKYVEDSLLGDAGDVSCYELSDLYDYISSGSKDKYTGVVEKNNDEWKIFITDGTYKINGKSSPIEKDDVKDGSKLYTTTCK